MKLIAAFSLSFLALPAFAISDAELSRACREVAVEKIQLQASAQDCEVIAQNIQLSDIDNRFYNPSKFLWYSVAATCEGSSRDTVTQIVQYKDGECF
jgi:hypothetical protein